MGEVFIQLFGIAVAAAIVCDMLHAIKSRLDKNNDHDGSDHDR